MSNSTLQPKQSGSGSGRLYPRCSNCDIEIRWKTIVSEGRVYCCSGCVSGGPCSCDYSQYEEEESPVIHLPGASK